MAKDKYKCILISDFTIENFAGYLNNDNEPPAVKGIIAPYGQVAQILADKNLKYRKEGLDFAIIWTRPESIIESFSKIINYKKVALKNILKEVDEYCALLLDISDRAKFTFVPTWALPYHGGFSLFDMKTGIGITNTLMHMNLRLSENLEKQSNIYILNTQKWIEAAGKKAFNPKLWYMGKIAFGNEVFIEAVKDIKAALRGISGQSKKLIVLDLDNTLWGGIVGDVGWEKIKLGGHDHTGEAYLDFQRALKSLASRGVLLAIVSKNEETVALEAIKKHPEMVLRLQDFVNWRINWKDKVQNIIDLVSDLNLGLQSVVFIDDDPVERARVREALSEVLVPEWPEDAMLYKKTLLDLRCFNMPSLSKEDAERTKIYALERKRKNLRKKAGSLDKWLKNLRIKIKVEELNKANLQRASQLLNKTNQMNLSTRRMGESELTDWAKQKNHKLWAFRVSDKFGDYGLIGIASIELENKQAKIVDFILSCRAIGRKLEEAMLYTLIKYAQSIGLDKVYAEYIPTPKNKPCLSFFKNSGFKQNKQNKFAWKTKNDYKIPGYVEIKQQ